MKEKSLHLPMAAAALALSYAIGSIPFGLWLAMTANGKDVRTAGSRSTGTTNVLRVAGPGAAALTFALDIGKGASAVALAKLLGLPRIVQSLCALAAAAGHCWPVFAGLRGGKGVATAFGGAVSISPPMGAAAAVTAVSTIAATKKVSAGSLLGVGAALGYGAVQAARSKTYAPLLFAAGATALIVFRHEANISRLLSGTEPSVELPFGRPRSGQPHR